MLCRVMYLMIMQAYGVCALIKVLGMIMVLRLFDMFWLLLLFCCT